MSLLLDLAYAAAVPVAIPLLLRKSWKTGKYRTGIADRLGMGDEPLPPPLPRTKTLLLHCVSVGELNSVQTLIKRLLVADENVRIVLTTGTDTGTDRARKLFPPSEQQRVFPLRFPFDFSFAVERLLDRTRPDASALVELETWPNFLEIAHDRGIPIAILNGRISDRSFPRYRLIRPLMAGMLKKVSWIGAQTETIAHRFAALGADDVQVIPTLKYDNAAIADRVAGQEALARAMGLTAGMRLIVAGSTGPGEENSVLDMYTQLRSRFSDLRLAIVPRHPEVVPQVVRAIQRRDLLPVMRTERPDSLGSVPPLQSREVFVLDTMGELRKLYALACAVFVGRSLIKKGGGGSDMIEVAALGKASCFGPYTANFAEVVEMLVEGGGAKTVQGDAELTQTVAQWLADPKQAAEMGKRAQELIRKQQDARATDQYVARLLEMLNSR
ncbi:MAG TPA: glycosyltransferase N-terminal domain-containing protein, partial [Phycisphaerae bacterium]|nr:glycosyltransferase N-terminal domain-containing protein [Phycisphaerae bacterium]